MVRNFLGQWKDKMLLPGSVAALGRQGNILSPAYGWTKMLQDWTICSWSQVMSVARIKTQMFLANPGNYDLFSILGLPRKMSELPGDESWHSKTQVRTAWHWGKVSHIGPPAAFFSLTVAWVTFFTGFQRGYTKEGKAVSFQGGKCKCRFSINF